MTTRPPSKVSPGYAMRRRAMRLATELCDMTAQEWLHDSDGAGTPIADPDDHPDLYNILMRAHQVTRSAPGPAPAPIHAQAGIGGLVVVAQARTWSLVALAGGPVLILCPGYPSGVRLDLDGTLRAQVGQLVADLIATWRTL